MLHNYLINLVNEPSPIILLGDLTFPDIKWTTYNATLESLSL